MSFNSKEMAIAKAMDLLDKNAIIIDTETTGLNYNDQIIEVSAIDCLGRVLMDTFVKPTCRIPEEATAIHGITDEMVADCQPWSFHHDQFTALVKDRDVAIYNAGYDVKMLLQTSSLYGLPDPLAGTWSVFCAMHLYSAYRGEWNPIKRGYRWHKLTDAAKHEGVDTSSMTAHRALGDVQMTLELIRVMAA